jgi:hypothetical protein
VFEARQSPTRSGEPSAVAKPERSAGRSASRANNPLLAKQRAFGNQAVQRQLLAGIVQAKLTVGRPNDPYEQEADRVAETVMRMPEPEVRRQTEPSSRAEEDEDPLRAEPAGRQSRPLQRKPKVAGITHVGDPALARRLRSPDGGSPLAAGTRAYFERRFGYDFSEVRVHDAYRDRADASALSARAFTYGRHIWLGHGESAGDTRLLAHELTHVVQQGAAVRRKPLVAGSVSPRVQRSWWDSVTEAVGGAIRSVGELAGAAKDRLLGQLAQWARRIPGFDLLTVILGKDPISDQPVERNAINLIRGVLGLVPGGTAMFENLQRARAIERAFEWFSTEIAKLNMTWETIKGLFRRAWDALSITDILDPANALAKVAQIFGPTLARLRDFAVAAGRKVLEFVFEGVLRLAGSFGTRVLGVIRRAGALITTIINDPIGFLGNLIRALRGGFERFSANILDHLRTGLLEWLFGALSGAGLTLPTRFDLKGIISIVLQVIGLTYDRLRAKLVDLIGDRNVRYIEGVFDFLVTILNGGLSAAWEKIVEFAGNLQETVIGGIRDWVARTIVGQAITRLVTMFNPVGAIIQGIMTIYNTVVFFIERAQQIAALADAVFDSISNIAAGNLGAAINYVERTMARTLPVIIGFLARLIGLGGISDRIKDIIRRIQAPVNRAIDRVADFIVRQAQRLIGGSQRTGSEVATLSPEVQRRWTRGMQELRNLQGRVQARSLKRESIPTELSRLKTEYGFRVLGVEHGRIHAQMNPEEWIPLEESGNEEYMVLVVEGQVTRVRLGDREIDLPTIDRAKTLVSQLRLDADEVASLMREIRALENPNAAKIGRLLLSYVRNIGDPTAFMKITVRRGVTAMAAVDTPLGERARSRLVRNYQQLQGRNPLSNIAFVFREKHFGQFTFSRGAVETIRAEHPTDPPSVQVFNSEYNYISPQSGQRGDAEVEALGGVEVDDNGAIVDVLAVHRNLRGGRDGLVTIMRNAGWTVNLRQPPSIPEVV